jgi:AbrB family looped-hinge helix DNA binding protein
MELVTISPEYYIVIPERIREKYHLKPDQKVVFIEKAKGISIVPDIPIRELRGFAKGIDAENIREKTEREL